MTYSEISAAIKTAIEEEDTFEVPEPFELTLTQVGTLRLAAQIDGVRCRVYATPKYEGADGIALNVGTMPGSDVTVDVSKVLDMPHLERTIEVAEKRDGGPDEVDRYDLACFWLKKVKPKAKALRELLSA